MAGYGSDEGLEAWLTANGYTLPETAPSLPVLRQKGSDYLDNLYEIDLPGYRTGGFDQERAFPRTDATARGQEIAVDAIPVAWVNASYAASWYEANNPDGLAVSATALGAVKREKVGPIETEYVAGSGAAAADATVRLSAVEGLVSPFLISANRYGGSVFVI